MIAMLEFDFMLSLNGFIMQQFDGINLDFSVWVEKKTKSKNY